MSEPLCPNCNKPLSQAVVKGPAQAVVRCEGCQTLLLWSNGRVMRSAKSATPTIMGMPAVGAPPAAKAGRDAEAPLPELKPEGDALPAQPKSSFPKPPPRTPPAAGKTPPPRTATQPVARAPQPKQTVTGLGDNVPTRVESPTPELRKEAARKDPTPAPMKVPPSGPVKLPPAAPMKASPSGPMKVPPSGPVKLPPAAPAARPTPAPSSATTGKTPPKAPEAPHVVAAVAQVPQMGPSGEMVDPSAWFAGGDVSDVVPPEKLPPIEGAKPTRADTTGAQPLPPPPSLKPLEAEPFEIEAPGTEATPAMGTAVPLDTGDLSERIAVREPSQKVATPPPPAKTPAPTKAVTDLPSGRTSIGKPPETTSRSTVFGRPALDLTPAKEPVKAEPPKAGPPRVELPKPAEPVAAAVSMLPPEPAPPPQATPAPTAMPAPNAPAPVVEREISAEALPPPPSSLETTMETPMPVRQPETMRVPRELPRRMILIAGGAAASVLVLVLIIVGLSHGSKAPTKPTPRPAVVATPQPSAPQPSVPTIAPTPTPSKAPAPPPPVAPTVATPEPAIEPPPVAPTPAPTKTRRTLGGKKVVLEYDPKPTSPTPPPPQAPTPMGEDPATVARAREAYHKGNVKLFAGDDKGAIDLYRESLKIYPGYVAGYRGLGLAYEEAGQKDDALKAFHTYVRTVPNAVDSAIIRRRIDHLEGSK